MFYSVLRARRGPTPTGVPLRLLFCPIHTGSAQHENPALWQSKIPSCTDTATGSTGRTFRYKKAFFSYGESATAATKQQFTRNPSPQPGMQGKRWPLAFHRTDTAQLQRKDNNTRNSSISRYKNIISRYDQSRGPATEQLFRVLPSATDPSTSSRVPRSPATPALRPFPYPESLCIMSPNPPQQQEHTPS